MPMMKDSGIEWIGKIPQDWEIYKIKHFFNVLRGRVISVLDLEDDGKYPVYSSQTENNGCFGYLNTYDYEGEAITWTTDGAKAGTVFYRNGKYNCTNVCGILQKKKNIAFETDIKFLTHAISMVAEQNKRADINGFKIMSNEMARISFAIPNIEIQKKISTYLDSKCAEIDALASDIRAEIDTLEEYKRSVVFDKVLHGLSNNTIMVETDSDVWDKMPQGWKLVDIKYLFEIVKRIAGKEGFDVLSVTQKGLRVKDITSGDGQLADNYSGYQFVYPTDYVMNHMDLLTGWVDLSSMFGVTSPDYRVFRLRDKRNNSLDYYKYVMQCCYMNRIFYSLGQGVSNLGRWRLQTSSFNNFKVPVPPLEEQVAIADFLNKTISETDAIIAEKQIQMATLDEYKKSLIYEYVTGKKEVPHEFNAKAVC